MSKRLIDEIHQLHAHLCNALADPNRILILYTLANGHRNVSQLAQDTKLPQPTVSRHLKILRDTGLASSSREGHSVFYEVADFRVIDALDTLRSVLADNLEKQAAVARSISASITSKDN
jgi:ArsR family transcriptional regulator